MPVALVAGALANRPGNAGGAWVRLSWVLGLRQLGFDVEFVEQIAPAACVDADGKSSPFNGSVNRGWFRRVTRSHGLVGSATLVYGRGEETDGRSFAELVEIAGAADLLVNISGHLTLRSLVSGPRVRAYLDLDPGFTQLWHASGAREVAAHDAYFTVGENIGRRGCPIPTGGIRWRPIRPPVVLEDWRADGRGELTRFTTVASWRGPFGPVLFGGRRLGLKVHEFRKFWSLPSRTGLRFEVALDIDAADGADRDELVSRGWGLASPTAVAGDPKGFRRYVTESGAEFSPAKSIYVESASGWFSDRTACYLAAGKPALVQDTGFSSQYPTEQGLIAFRTLEEAIRGAEAIADAYDEHRRVARELAETFFDSRIVLGRFLDELDVTP